MLCVRAEILPSLLIAEAQIHAGSDALGTARLFKVGLWEGEGADCNDSRIKREQSDVTS